MENRISIVHLALTIVLFLSTILLGRLSRQVDEEKSRYLNPPPEHIELFHFGFRESIADSLWLRWIQDNDSCQTYTGRPIQKLVDTSTDVFAGHRHKICDNSWSFKMLDAVTMLSPRFEM